MTETKEKEHEQIQFDLNRQDHLPAKIDEQKQAEIGKKIKENEEKIKQNTKKALPGKCPIRLTHKLYYHEDGNLDKETTINKDIVNLDSPLFREPFKSSTDVIKHLTATTDSDLANEILIRGISAMPNPNSGNNVTNANMIVQGLADSEPKDATEAKLTVQATALYAQGMQYLKRAEGALDDDCFDKQGWNQIFMKNALKLLRLHNETIEALSKYRRGGEQKVVVQHVNIDNRSQAIVNNGNVAVGGGGEQKIAEVTPC